MRNMRSPCSLSVDESHLKASSNLKVKGIILPSLFGLPREGAPLYSRHPVVQPLVVVMKARRLAMPIGHTGEE
jgi:hypothetical protein